MEISAGILGLLHYIDRYLCHLHIRVHSCEHMWAGDPRFTMCRCVSVEVGVTESGLGWAKWSTMKHVFCEEWDWIKRPTYHITSPQPLHITPPMHTIPYTPPSSRLQPVLGALDVQSIKGLSLNQSAFTNYLSIRPPSSVCALHPLSPSSEPLLYVFYNPPVHPNNKHWGQCDAKCFLAVIIGLVVEWMCVICVWMKGGTSESFYPCSTKTHSKWFTEGLSV